MSTGWQIASVYQRAQRRNVSVGLKLQIADEINCTVK